MSPPGALWLELFFYLAFTLSLLFFHLAHRGALKYLVGLLVWSALHGLLAYNGFYENTIATPPRFALVLAPSTLLIILALRKKSIDWLELHRDRKWSTLSHSVRIPVELTLWGLFSQGLVPELMTFEGRNFDILAGLSAPIITFLYLRFKLSDRLLLVWNAIGLILVLFILVNGILSAELPFQQFGFDQPNRAVALFPYIWLPAVIVPLVLWTHLSDILLLLRRIKKA